MGKYFPLFVNLEKKKILVVGAGKIATRRIGALLEFGAHITVTAPKASKQVEAWAKEGRMACRLCEYRPGLIKDYFRDSDLVLAATSDPMVNEAVWAECKKLGIPVNVSSDKTKCDFYFGACRERRDRGGCDRRGFRPCAGEGAYRTDKKRGITKWK